jgi:hypothetical protein
MVDTQLALRALVSYERVERRHEPAHASMVAASGLGQANMNQPSAVRRRSPDEVRNEIMVNIL